MCLAWLAHAATFVPLLHALIRLAARVPLRTLLLLLPAAVLMNSVVVIVACAALRRLVCARAVPGECLAIWSAPFARWWLAQRLLHAATVPLLLLRGSPACALALKLFGARVGRGAVVETAAVSEPELLEVGEGASLGRDVAVVCHTWTRGHIRFDTVVVGAHAAVGPGSVLSAGAVVGARASVAPLSHVLGGRGGVPAGAHLSLIHI